MSFDADDISDEDMLRTLASFGVIRATIEFSGGGDSGEMGEVDVEGLVDPEKVPAPEGFTERLKRVCGTHHYNYTTRQSEQITVYNIKHLLEAYAYDVVERTGVDWCNNEGGGGTLTIVPGIGTIDLEMYYNVTEQVDCGQDFSITVPWDTDTSRVAAKQARDEFSEHCDKVIKELEAEHGGSVSPFPVVSEEVGWGS
jgi:hypothetical protein